MLSFSCVFGLHYKQVVEGALFWFITKGDVKDGMPAWAGLPEKERWQIVTYLKTLPTVKAAATEVSAVTGSTITTPPPTPPFTDFRGSWREALRWDGF